MIWPRVNKMGQHVVPVQSIKTAKLPVWRIVFVDEKGTHTLPKIQILRTMRRQRQLHPVRVRKGHVRNASQLLDDNTRRGRTPRVEIANPLIYPLTQPFKILYS